MVVNEKALRSRIKEAFKNQGYTVAVDDGVMWINGGYWLVWMNTDEVGVLQGYEGSRGPASAPRRNAMGADIKKAVPQPTKARHRTLTRQPNGLCLHYSTQRSFRQAKLEHIYDL